MNHCVTGCWAAARSPSRVVVLLAGLALSGAGGCGQGRETAAEGTESEPAAAAESERGPESSRAGEAAERREHDDEREGEHDSEGEHAEEAGESGIRYGVSETARETRSGVELVPRFDTSADAFVGTVTSAGAEPVSRVRVEVHFVGAVGLGPTPTSTLAPGETNPVRLETAGHQFEAWTPHLEIGEGEHSREGRRHH